MTHQQFSVVTFHSTSHAIQADKVCRRCGVKVKLIPVPRHISSDCGVCIRFQIDEKEKVLAALEERKVEISQVVDLE